jgi:RNase P subunit RPR2
MPERRLKVIDATEAAQRVRLAVTSDKPLVQGGGDWQLLCGNCGTVLAENVREKLPARDSNNRSYILVCCACGANNDQA